MNLKKLFDFTKQLEYTLEKLSEIDNISEQRKDNLLKKLAFVVSFNNHFQYNKNLALGRESEAGHHEIL